MNYFTEKTWVPVGSVAALILVAVSTTVWIVNTINEADRKNNERWIEIQKQLQEQNNVIQTLSKTVNDSWTIALQSEFSLRLQSANPELRIPDPRDLTKTLK